MIKDKDEIKRYICYAVAGLCFLVGIIQMITGLVGSNDGSPWYDYFVVLLFLVFIGAMVLRLAKTYNRK